MRTVEKDLARTRCQRQFLPKRNGKIGPSHSLSVFRGEALPSSLSPVRRGEGRGEGLKCELMFH